MSVTLRDIANAVGVDISTVSKVLQGAPIRVSQTKRDQIHQTAREMNYRPNAVARGLRLKRSGAIAMPIPSTTNYLFPEIINGAEEAAERLGFVLFLLKQSTSAPAEQLLSLIRHGRVDGLLFADEMPSSDLLETFIQEGIPYISLNRIGGDDRYVALDDEAGFGCQARFIAALGHRCAAFVRVEPSSFVSRFCEQAFLDAAASLGVECPPSHRLPSDFSGSGCMELARKVLGLSPRPAAVATASVVVAARLVEGFRSFGVSVPDDIGVIGYHDSPVAQWPPPGVTTVRMPSRLQGCRGVEALVQLIEGGRFLGEIIEATPEVIDRGTLTAING